MTARQPRRTRRRNVAAAPLPRPESNTPEGVDELIVNRPAPAAVRAPRRPLGARAHHVLTDYRYVRSDLATVAVIGLIALGFIIGMSFVVN